MQKKSNILMCSIDFPWCLYSYKDQMNMLAEALQAQREEQEIRGKAQAKVNFKKNFWEEFTN